MMRLLVAIVAVTFLGGLSTPPARADFMDGKVLASLCTSDVDWEAGGCVGFIVGVADAFDHRHLSSTGGANGGKYCIPDSATREEIVGLVVRALDENPDKSDSLALHLASNAFIDAFDCNADLKYPL